MEISYTPTTWSSHSPLGLCLGRRGWREGGSDGEQATPDHGIPGSLSPLYVLIRADIWIRAEKGSFLSPHRDKPVFQCKLGPFPSVMFPYEVKIFPLYYYQCLWRLSKIVYGPKWKYTANENTEIKCMVLLKFSFIHVGDNKDGPGRRRMRSSSLGEVTNITS